MGLGANSTSLLHKLGLKKAHEIPLLEYQAFVKAQQTKRSLSRAVAVLQKLSNEPSKRSKRADSPPVITLESLTSPSIAQKLRAQWPQKPDFELILLLKARGVLWLSANSVLLKLRLLTLRDGFKLTLKSLSALLASQLLALKLPIQTMKMKSKGRRMTTSKSFILLNDADDNHPSRQHSKDERYWTYSDQSWLQQRLLLVRAQSTVALTIKEKDDGQQ